MSSRPPPPTSPPPPPPTTSLLYVVVVWLTGISTWQRTAIALVLGGALLTGLLIYRHPAETFEVLRAAVGPHPPREHAVLTYYPSDVQRELDRLLATFGPAMIGTTAWRIDVETNHLKLVRAAVAPEFRPLLAQLEAERWRWPVPFFGDNPKTNDLLARILIGRFVCTAPADTWTEALDRFPIAELCLVAIPPDGVGMAGLLGGAWRTPIPDPERPRIEMAFRAAAAALVWRPLAR